MTIEQLLGHSVEDLEKLTDDELLAILGPLIELEPKADLKHRSQVNNETKVKEKKSKVKKDKKGELMKMLLELEGISE